MSRVATGSRLNHVPRRNALSRRIAPGAQRLPLQVGQRAPQPLHGSKTKASRPPLTHDNLHGEDHHRPGGDGTWPQSKGLAEAVPVEQGGKHQGLGQVDGQGQAADRGQGREGGPVEASGSSYSSRTR